MVSPAVGRLGRPELAPLVDELVRRFADGGAPATLTLRGLPDPSRRALADLLGTDRLPASLVRVRVERLLFVLGLASVDDLRAAIESLRGPLPDRRADREAERAAREELWAWVGEQAQTLPFAADAGRLVAWVAAQRAAGVRGGVEAHRRRLTCALAALRALPADGTSLAAIAADRAGDPHALDHGRAVAGMVLDAIASAFAVPRAVDAEGARALWETVGVVPDPLSSTVLALGLPGGDDGPLRRWLGATAGAGEPVVLTLSMLRSWPLPPLPAGSTAFVVENPSLVLEAAAGGWAGPPLMCSSGRPSFATVMLLRQLGANGATVYQHADFDPGGLAITAWLAERAGTTPWRMTTGDYLSALDGTTSRQTLVGPVPRTPWDATLQQAVEGKRAAVYEEEVRTQLLDEMCWVDRTSQQDRSV